MKALLLVILAGIALGAGTCADWPQKDVGRYFILVQLGQPASSWLPFIAVDREKRQVTMFGKDLGHGVTIDEWGYTQSKAKDPTTQDSWLGAVTALIDYALACATHWKVNRWQDLLPERRDVPKRLRPNIQDEVGK